MQYYSKAANLQAYNILDCGFLWCVSGWLTELQGLYGDNENVLWLTMETKPVSRDTSVCLKDCSWGPDRPDPEPAPLLN